MRVKVLQNYEDSIGNIHLVNDVLDINESEFKPQLHSEDVTTKKRAVKNNRKTTKKTEPSESNV